MMRYNGKPIYIVDDFDMGPWVDEDGMYEVMFCNRSLPPWDHDRYWNAPKHWNYA